MKNVLSAEVEFKFYFCVLESGYIIVYEVGFLDSIKEISIKIDYFPIRRSLRTISNSYGYDNEEYLVEKDNIVYFLDNENKLEVYKLD